MSFRAKIHLESVTGADRGRRRGDARQRGEAGELSQWGGDSGWRGLPLGILAESRYEETSCQLGSGDRPTFVSDRVVEATSPHGELCGFERTQAISSQNADLIAEAAQLFGQEDDIAVLTLTRLAEGWESKVRRPLRHLCGLDWTQRDMRH